MHCERPVVSCVGNDSVSRARNGAVVQTLSFVFCSHLIFYRTETRLRSTIPAAILISLEKSRRELVRDPSVLDGYIKDPEIEARGSAILFCCNRIKLSRLLKSLL